ncbi:hypothetical protein ACLMJK_000906 [Lecanora helva]
MASIDDQQEAPSRPDRPPRDEEIKAFKVQMVRPEDNRLTEPVLLYDVLQSRQRDDKGRFTQTLQEVAPINVESGRYYPICRMFDKKQQRESELAKRKANKEKKQQQKQLELNWTVSDNDLSHRMGRLKEFLEKGCKVEVLFGRKRKGWMGRREPSEEEINKVLERIRGTVAEVDGAKEWRGMQGEAGKEAMLSFEGRPKKD